MKHKVFVDGQEGTTGLQINERLETRDDIEIIKISPEKRKDADERRRLLNEADIVFLCLPDAAAIEAVSMIENNNTKVIDASTAHRTHPDWAYGLPELSAGHREAVRASSRVSVPGCYATGFNIALYPLVKEGIVPPEYPVSCHAVSGYSGGGKKLIGLYENPGEEINIHSPQFYALGLTHKHLPEMQKVSGLKHAPIFSPILGNIYKGMTVAIPLASRMLSGKTGAGELQAFLSDYYKDEPFVKVMPLGCEKDFYNGYLGATGCNDRNAVELYVFGHSDQVMLVSRLDNLGKGSSGAAVQNMNLLLGLGEGTGLE